MNLLLPLVTIISFFSALFLIPVWIRKCQQNGLLWEDMNKSGHPKNLASSGGTVVILSFVLSILVYIAIRTFVIKDIDEVSLKIFSLLSMILILAVIGLVDDLLGWKKEGLSARFRVFLVLFASIPLVVINAGVSEINLPFVGTLNLGLFYVFGLIPFGIAGATFGYNNLAGFNGLEASQGIIILSFLSFIAYKTGLSWLALIGLCMVFALIAFYQFNKYPAKVVPGDILTYSVGALIASMAILGNFEKIALFVFSLYLLETVLKLRGYIDLKKFPQCFGIPNKNGGLELPYKKLYSVTHVSILLLKRIKRDKEAREKEVVYFINFLQIIIIIIGLLIF